jgi:hypothetical protein
MPLISSPVTSRCPPDRHRDGRVAVADRFAIQRVTGTSGVNIDYVVVKERAQQLCERNARMLSRVDWDNGALDLSAGANRVGMESQSSWRFAPSVTERDAVTVVVDV